MIENLFGKFIGVAFLWYPFIVLLFIIYEIFMGGAGYDFGEWLFRGLGIHILISIVWAVFDALPSD